MSWHRPRAACDRARILCRQWWRSIPAHRANARSGLTPSLFQACLPPRRDKEKLSVLRSSDEPLVLREPFRHRVSAVAVVLDLRFRHPFGFRAVEQPPSLFTLAPHFGGNVDQARFARSGAHPSPLCTSWVGAEGNGIQWVGARIGKTMSEFSISSYQPSGAYPSSSPPS